MSILSKRIAEGTVDRLLQEKATYGDNIKKSISPFVRYVIFDSIFDPNIIDKQKIEYWEHSLKISNMEYATVLPRNTVIGKRIYEDGITPPMFLFPMFGHLALPCKPGEHVWVMFEHPTSNIGYWVTKIIEPGFVDDVNHTHAPRTFDPTFTPKIKDIYDNKAKPIYEFRNGRPELQNGERYTDVESYVISSNDETIYEKLLTDTDASKLITHEAIPRYHKRPGDVVLEGSNNSSIVLGTDRVGLIAEYENDAKKGNVPKIPTTDKLKEAASIDLVVGRGQTKKTGGVAVTSNKLDKSEFLQELGKSSLEIEKEEGNPDLINDRSRILISQKTATDINLKLDGFNSKFDISDSPDGDGSIIIKSDKIRLIARKDIEILVSNFETKDGKVIDATNQDDYSAIILRSDGNIIFKPSKKGYIKLGGEDADKGIVCSDMPVSPSNGGVVGPPLTTTMGGQFAGAKISGDDNLGALAPGQAKYANKVLIK